jgi:hypothetical protein
MGHLFKQQNRRIRDTNLLDANLLDTNLKLPGGVARMISLFYDLDD